MKFALKSLVLVAACMLLAVAANAQSVMSVSYNPLVPVSLGTTDWHGTLLFPEFNPSLGPLIEVDIDVSSGIQTTLTVINDAASSSSGTAKADVQVTVTDSDSLLSLGPDVYSPGFAYSLLAGDSTGSGLLTNTGSDLETYTSAPILAEFTGAGYISLGASTFTETDLSNTGGNTLESQVTQASATGTVTYWYNCDVPEPSSLLALGTMFGAAFFAIRRRR